MFRASKWTVLAVAGLVAWASVADACKRGRRGGRGGGGDHHASYYQGADGRYYAYQNGAGGRHSFYPQEQQFQGQGQLQGQVPPQEQLPAPVQGQQVNERFIEMTMPADDAQIWVNGQLFEGSGASRKWMVPAGNQQQNFEVRGRWLQNGQEVNQTRNVTIGANGRATVDFTRPNVNNPSPK